MITPKDLRHRGEDVMGNPMMGLQGCTEALSHAAQRSGAARTSMPSVLRLVVLEQERTDEKHAYDARLYYANQTWHVEWSSRRPADSLQEGMLVRPFSVAPDNCPSVGPIKVGGLSVLSRPEPHLNLFDTLPPSWVPAEDLVLRGRRLVDLLPASLRHLFNAILWDADRFRSFCHAPASIRNHHAYPGGLLQHTIETAELALKLSEDTPGVHHSLMLMAALLHDVGKAEEYEPNRGSGWHMTDRGKLIGHGTTIIEWLASAAAQPCVDLDDELYLALLHILTAKQGAPDWLGLRVPAMLEAEILSQADRLSGKSNLLQYLQNPHGGWGQKHPHMRTPPFTLAPRGGGP